MRNARRSPWRDEARWQERLEADRRAVGERLSADQREVLQGVAEAVGADDPSDVVALDFLVVFGSYARGDQRPGSDLDIYFEAANLREPFNRVDQNRHYQVFGMPRWALLDELRGGREFGRGVVRDALVVHDQGRLREILVAREEGEFE